MAHTSTPRHEVDDPAAELDSETLGELIEDCGGRPPNFEVGGSKMSGVTAPEDAGEGAPDELTSEGGSDN